MIMIMMIMMMIMIITMIIANLKSGHRASTTCS